jgi:nucleoid-associated protein EbfC
MTMDLNKLMEAASQMQSRMADAQSKVGDLSCEGQAGAGLVKATVNGHGKLTRLAIDPTLFRPEDREVVEDLIVAAVADAQKKAADLAQAEMAKLTQGLPLPPGIKLPF